MSIFITHEVIYNGKLLFYERPKNCICNQNQISQYHANARTAFKKRSDERISATKSVQKVSNARNGGRAERRGGTLGWGQKTNNNSVCHPITAVPILPHLPDVTRLSFVCHFEFFFGFRE